MSVTGRRIRVDVEDVQILVELVDEHRAGQQRLDAHEALALERLRIAVIRRLRMTWLR